MRRGRSCTNFSWLRRSLRLFGVVVGLALTHTLWLPPIGAFLIVADRLQPADAIVPLAGDPLRVPAAARLWQRGAAPWFVVTSMATPEANYGVRVKETALRFGVAQSAIVGAPGMATTTYGEAQILRDIAAARGWRALLIVTSPSHTRRARMIFRAVFADSGIRISVQPVTDHWYTAQTWWRQWIGVRETALEYTKLGLYLIGYHAITSNRQ